MRSGAPGTIWEAFEVKAKSARKPSPDMWDAGRQFRLRTQGIYGGVRVRTNYENEAFGLWLR